MCPMTDFYRKVNKFFQKFAKCDPKKQIKPNLWHPVILIFLRDLFDGTDID